MAEQVEGPRVGGCPVCAELKRGGYDSGDYSIVPAVGGGWGVWSAALVRLLDRSGQNPTRAVVISQHARHERYVQVLIGHGIAYAEASSNVYLEGDSRLDDRQAELLSELGWRSPGFRENDSDEPSTNWSLPLVRGDWQYLVEMFLATIVGVFEFSDELPVDIRSFLAEHPCAKCSWGDELVST